MSSSRSNRTTVQASTASTWSGGSRTCSDDRCGTSRAPATEPRFLVVGRSQLARPAPAETLPADLLERLILYGALTTLDGAEPAGVALALQAPSREAVDALMNDERTGLGALSEVEIHNWEFGGRR